MLNPRKTEIAAAPARSKTTWLKPRRLLFLGCLALSTLALSQYRNVILLVSHDAREFDFGGGPGGRPVSDARCDGGFVAVGFHVQTGEYFNEAWLDCAPMRSDGSLGEERRITNRTGSPGGRAVHDAHCPPGSVLRGLTGRTGASIDEAVGECGMVRGRDERDDRRWRDDRRDDDQRTYSDDRRGRDDDRRADNDDHRWREDDRRGHDDDRFDRNRMELTEPVAIPRPGGRPAEAQCPPGSVLVGFRTRSGQWIDHLSILCSEVQRSY